MQSPLAMMRWALTVVEVVAAAGQGSWQGTFKAFRLVVCACSVVVVQSERESKRARERE